MKEDQAGSNPRLSHVALARPDPEPMHDDFVATVYPQVHKSLKHITEEHVHLENPLSSSGTLSSMKNLDETFGDQFFNDKPTKEPGKTNVETKVKSMVIVPIHKASSTTPPLSTPIINLSPSKPVSTPVQKPIFTATTTTTTTTLPLPPPLQTQSSIDADLAARTLALEKKYAKFEKNNKTLENTTKNLGSRIFNLELSLQALLLDCFRDLSEADMKEILHQRMFESGLYKSYPEHVTLYEAIKAYIEHANKDELRAEKANLQLLSPQLGKLLTLEKLLLAPSSRKDTSDAHLPKIKTRSAWLKPVPEEERPETPELE
ncbi:hypothetical protein Tco_0941101 [Tanacetum coccineum]|uniref:Uncharacterized protein n=1 Tax=Tanacetum coccineum TaxID=301880 RepID=A0ABQ5DSH8_9ASTR